MSLTSEQDEGRSGEQQDSHPSLEQMIQTAVEAFRVVSETEHLSLRMADAETTVALHVTDLGEKGGLTALLDRNPIEVVDHVIDSESRIYGDADAWLPVFTGGNLGIAVALGELSYEGPVRKFLRVFPIFRTAYAEVARGRRSTETEDGEK